MSINDNLHEVYGKFAEERLPNSFDRFPGMYRAEVVETNDPLNMHRVRFKCPELHDFDVKTDDCPWAVPLFSSGGKGSGSWSAPCIGDIIWISFEKQHPYGPVWTGFAEPTRVRFYKLHSVFQKGQIYVDSEGKPQSEDELAWIEKYGPKDGRPYSQGTTDRYGNMLVMNMTGFFPKEHDVDPADAGTDAIADSVFKAQKARPKSNEPDTKMMAMVSKYGHYMILGDQGYDWEADFKGDFKEDYENEKKRQEKLIKLLNEDEPKSGEDYDQRRMEFRTALGHKFEMRDVGFGQPGPKQSKARKDDLWPEENTISKFNKRDERWLKLRTKGGHLLQFMDMGNDPNEDAFVRRNRIEEVGGKADGEDDNWQNRDARQMRLVTRYGFKLVLDDRGTDDKAADEKEDPRGNGILMKGRRKSEFDEWTDPGAEESTKDRILTKPTIGYKSKHKLDSEPRGYGVDINEKDELNRLMIYSPKSAAIEINDRYDYVMASTAMNDSLSEDWQYLKENEFSTAISMMFKPETTSYTMKLDRANTYAALGTPLGQAFEMRDGYDPETEGFLEARDMDDRALILSKALKLAAIHDPKLMKFFAMLDDKMLIVMQNLEGNIQLYSTGDIEFKAANIKLHADSQCSILCNDFQVQAGGTMFGVDAGGFGSTGPMFAPESNAVHIGCMPGLNAGSASSKGSGASPVSQEEKPKMIPDLRRGKNNENYVDREAAQKVIEGQQ